MIININNTYLDLDNFKIVEAAAKAIPFATGTIFRRLKPPAKFKRKINNIWVASSKISLEYLMACYMLEKEVEKVICFVRLVDGRHFIMEFVIGKSPHAIQCAGTFIRETPSDYLEMENKAFDEIIGNVDIANTTLNFSRLSRYAKTSLEAKDIAVIAVGAAIAIGSLTFTVRMFLPQKKEISVKQQVSQPLLLTEKEKEALNHAVIREFVEKFDSAVRGRGSDKALNSVKLSVQSNDHIVSGVLSLEYKSFYPYSGAARITDGGAELYRWTDNISIEKSRRDIPTAAYKEPLQCLKKAIDDSWKVSMREKAMWHMDIEEKEYGKFADKINSLIECPVSVNSIEMTEGSFKCSLILSL